MKPKSRRWSSCIPVITEGRPSCKLCGKLTAGRTKTCSGRARHCGEALPGSSSATCGAVASAAVCLGLRHRRPLDDKEAAARAHEAACNEAREMAREFIEKFGAMSCLELVGMEMLNHEDVQAGREGGTALDRCEDFIRAVIDKLYELEAKRD